MDGFTLIDGIVAAVIVLSAVLAFSRGLVHEVMAIAGWVVAAIVGYAFAAQAQPLMTEIPVVGEILADSCELALIIAFFAVMFVALLVAWLFTPLLSSAVQKTALSGLDQGLGFLFGVGRGVLLVAVAFFVYETVLSAQGVAMVDNSRSAEIFSQVTTAVEEQDPDQALGWFQAKYDALAAQSCS